MTTKQTENKKSDDAVAAFLANGGTIQKIGRNVSGVLEGQTISWGMKKPVGKTITPPDDSEDS